MFFGPMLVLALANPAPAATSVPEIAHVRTSAFCTAFREQVVPSVQGLLANDSLVATSQAIYAALESDAVDAGVGNTGHGFTSSHDDGRMSLDEIHLDLALHDIVQNLQKLDGIVVTLDDRIAHAAPQDRADLSVMRASVAAVIAQQKVELNTLGGLLATEQLGDLQASGDSLTWVTMPEADQQKQASLYGSAQPTPDPNLGAAHVNDAGLPDTPNDRLTAGRLERKTQTGNNPYRRILTQLAPTRAALTNAENLLALQITSGADACNLTSQPSPSP